MKTHADRLLVVEDDADVREALAIYLEAEGYQVIQAENGEDALRKLRAEGSVCLILLDLFMPVMDGWAFREAQRADPQLVGIPVIVVSADRLVADSAAELGAVCSLRKPINFDELVRQVGTFC